MIQRNHSDDGPGYVEVPQGNNYAVDNTFSNVATEKDLIKELAQPRREANGPIAESDTSIGEDQAQAGRTGFSFDPPPEEGEIKPDPIFPGLDIVKDEELPGLEEPERKLNKGQSERKLNAILKARNILQARILAKVALVKDKSRFMMSEDEFKILVDAYLPYMEEHGGKIPVCIDILIAEAIVLGDKIADAMNVRQTNLENQRLKSENAELRGKLVAHVSTAIGERKNWKIDANGFYEKDAYGDYIKKAQRKEKASLKDIEELVFYNSPEIIKAVFGLTDAEIAAYDKDAA